jgi:rRNA maturation protein Nop10
MAKTKQVRVCKACNAELLKKDQLICHVCGFRLHAPENKRFASPDYLYYQKQDHLKEDLADKDEKTQQAILEDFVKWTKTCPEEDLIAACHDAFYLLRYAALSGATSKTIIEGVRLGKKVGALANSIEQYVKNQGAINVSAAGEAEPTDGLEG